MNAYTAIWDVLAYVVLPLWVFAGFADYLCHRGSHMTEATGPTESVLHWLMLLEMGSGVLMALFLRINALTLLLMALIICAHEITGYFDLKLAKNTRVVSVVEHQIHSFLDVLPFMALCLLALLHWPQALALLGLGPTAADWTLAFKEPPAWQALVPPALLLLLLTLVPYGEELWRGLSRRRKS
jgi:hypothetical protein